MAKKDDKTVKVIAELAVISGEGLSYRVKTFDRAWHLALELPTPVTLTFIGFTRAD
jgi:hypothetical protein